MPFTDRARIRAGQFRRRITIQQPVVTGTTRSWSNLVSVWAQVQPQSGFERASGALSAPNEIMIEVRTRYLPSVQIRPRMRILIASSAGNRVLEISDVLNVRELNRLLILQCREVTT